MPPPANTVVEHYRFRYDNGSETTATWLAAEDTPATILVPGSDTAFRLRLAVSDFESAGTMAYGLEVSKNAGGAIEVNSTSAGIKGNDSANVTDGGDTTNQLTLDPGLAYVTRAGQVDNVDAVSGTIILAVGEATELEWSLIVTAAEVAPGDIFDFFLRIDSGFGAITQLFTSVRLIIAAGLGSDDHPAELEFTKPPGWALPKRQPQLAQQDEIRFVLRGEEEHGILNLVRPVMRPVVFSRPLIMDAGEMAGASAGLVLIATLKNWISVEQANFWCACRVQANAAFRLNLLSTQDADLGPSYIVKQTASSTITVDGATADYTEIVDLDFPWPRIGRLEVWAAAGTLYHADVRLYYKRR